mgnify:CR=1 FL=1
MGIENFFKPSSEKDIIEKKERTIRHQAGRFLKIDSRQPEGQPAIPPADKSGANSQFLDEITEGVIRSLEKHGLVARTNELHFSGIKDENKPSRDIMRKAEDRIKEMMERVDGDVRRLEKEEQAFIKLVVKVRYYNEKANQRYIRREPEQFNRGLKAVTDEFVADREVQNGFLGITNSKYMGVNVDPEKFDVDRLELRGLDLSDIDLWKIKGNVNWEKDWERFYKRGDEVKDSMQKGEDALHEAQYLGIVAENSDLCKRILKNYVNLKYYMQQGETKQLRIDLDRTKGSLVEDSKQLSAKNEAALKASGRESVPSKEELRKKTTEEHAKEAQNLLQGQSTSDATILQSLTKEDIDAAATLSLMQESCNILQKLRSSGYNVNDLALDVGIDKHTFSQICRDVEGEPLLKNQDARDIHLTLREIYTHSEQKKLKDTRTQLMEQLRQTYQYIGNFNGYKSQNEGVLRSALAADSKNMNDLDRELETAFSNYKDGRKVLFRKATVDFAQLENDGITQTAGGPVIKDTGKGVRDLENALNLLQSSNKTLKLIDDEVQNRLSKAQGKLRM